MRAFQVITIRMRMIERECKRQMEECLRERTTEKEGEKRVRERKRDGNSG